MTAPAFCPEAGAAFRFDTRAAGRSTYPEVFGGFLPAVGHDFVAYLRALIQAAQTCSLDGRDMDEHVLAASVGLNKSKALRRVEPFYCTCCHTHSPQSILKHVMLVTEI